MYRHLGFLLAGAAVFSLGCTQEKTTATEESSHMTMSLSEKERIFEYDMTARFLDNGQALCKLRLPTSERPFISYNMPDNAYMTGIYLGALSMKYAVTQNPRDREDAAASLRALDLLCNVSGKRGLLARAAVPAHSRWHDDGEWHASPDGAYMWRGDVSSDQVDGVMYGFAVAYDLAADEEGKKTIARNAAAIADHILSHDLRIIDITGKPTMWGNYTLEYVRRRENMNALLLLQVLKVAHHVTGDARFEQEYRRIAIEKQNADIAVTARKSADPLQPGAVNHSDDVLLYLAFYPLLTHERDPVLREKYLAAFRRFWEGDGRYPGVKPEANPLYAFSAHAFLDDASGDADAIDTLRWFPFDLKWNRDTLSKYQQQFGFVFEPAPRSPEPKGPGPIPIDRRPKTWSAWVQNPYEAGDRSPDSGLEFNGHDYLAGYWLGRYHGYITENM